MEDERDADDAVRRLDNRDFGPKGRRLRVEWTKQDRGGRRSDDPRQSAMNRRPSKTLFVINFDPVNTRSRDLERHFDSYGKIDNVRIRRNFAFVQFDTQEEATKALEATNSSKFMDRVISVEYASRDNDDNQRNDSRRNGQSPDRKVRERSVERGYRGKRSPSPYRRERDSPDYGHGSKPVSRYEPRRSPSYEKTGQSPIRNVETRSSSRHERRRSPSYDRKRSPSYERKQIPVYDGPNKSPTNNHDSRLSDESPERSPEPGGIQSSPHANAPYDSPSYD